MTGDLFTMGQINTAVTFQKQHPDPVTFGRVDEHLHVFKDPQAQQLLSGQVSLLHDLKPGQK